MRCGAPNEEEVDEDADDENREDGGTETATAEPTRVWRGGALGVKFRGDWTGGSAARRATSTRSARFGRSVNDGRSGRLWEDVASGAVIDAGGAGGAGGCEGCVRSRRVARGGVVPRWVTP